MARSCTVDALEKFRFLVEFLSPAGAGEASPLDRAGFFEVQMPKRSTNKITYREGDDPDIFSLSAGLSTMEDITLSRGLIKYQGDGSALYRWMAAVHKPGNLPPSYANKGVSKYRPDDEAKAEYRKDLRITVLDRTGQPARMYEIYNAFVVNFVPGSDMNAGEDGEKMLESITITFEDFKEKKPDGSGDAAGSASA